MDIEEFLIAGGDGKFVCAEVKNRRKKQGRGSVGKDRRARLIEFCVQLQSEEPESDK